MANEFQGETNNLMMKEFNYMNSLKVSILNDSPQLRSEIDLDDDIDIFDQPSLVDAKEQLTINFAKLSRYIHIVFKTRHRDDKNG